MKYFLVTCYKQFPRYAWTVMAADADQARNQVVRHEQLLAAQPKPPETDPDAWDVYRDAREADSNQILAALWDAEIKELDMDKNLVLRREVLGV